MMFARETFEAALSLDRETPLVDVPGLARHCGIGRLLVKNEAERALGNFKSLGGLRAGLAALARAAGGGSRFEQSTGHRLLEAISTSSRSLNRNRFGEAIAIMGA